MFCHQTKLRAGVAKISSDGEKLFVTKRPKDLGGAMFCHQTKLRAGVAKISSDGEKLFVTKSFVFKI
jgi:hypothetical protein